LYGENIGYISNIKKGKKKLKTKLKKKRENNLSFVQHISNCEINIEKQVK
jgi:DNA-dependent RNA polymerase auxiliary subunit epsilon